MSKELPLADYVPLDQRGERVELVDDLAPVVDRLTQVLPAEKIWKMFSSTPNETGGRAVFPYCRVDNAVLCVRNWIWLATNYNPTPEKIAEYYQNASRQAFEALTWVEIGFQGLQNLATNKASVNWTSAVGHFVNDEERARGIMTTGKEMYDSCLRDFVEFRNGRELRDDDFSRFNLEHLLQTIPR